MNDSSNFWFVLSTLALVMLVGGVSLFLSVQKPSNLTAISVSATEVSLSWSGKGNFLIYRSLDKKNFQEIAEISSNSFVDKDLKPNTTYYYFLKAKSFFFTSQPSEILSVTTKYNLCGYVKDAQGKGIPNVEVVAKDHETHHAFSDSNGYWCLKNLSGKNEIVIFKKRYSFFPNSMIVNGPMSNITFEGKLSNVPPESPTLLSPANNKNNMDTTVTLKWNCTDPDGDPLHYNLYVKESGKFNLVASSLSINIYNLKNLSYGTTYYWKVEAEDPYGAKSESPVWTFTTKYYHLSGKVIYKDENANLEGIKITFNGTKTVFTDKKGQFSNGPFKGKVLVEAYKRGWRFSPKFIEVSGPSSEVNFVATPTVGTILQRILEPHFIFSSPAISKNGTLYFGDLDGNFYALSPNGKIKWKISTNRWIWDSPVIGKDGTIYFASDTGSIYALSSNGKIKWKHFIGGFVFSSPAIDKNKNVYIGNKDGKFYSINSEGEINWVKELDGKIESSPAISEDGVVYVGTDRGILYAIDSSGIIKWKFKTNGEIFSSPAISKDGTIYFGSLDKNFYALSPNGKEKWKVSLDGSIYSSPVIDSDGNIYIGSDKGTFYAVDKYGKVEWIFKTGGKIISTPLIGENDLIYLCTKNGLLYVLNKRGEKVWTKELNGSPFYSSPIVSSQGVMYLGALGIFAIQTNTFGVKGEWPKFRMNLQNTAAIHLKK